MTCDVRRACLPIGSSTVIIISASPPPPSNPYIHCWSCALVSRVQVYPWLQRRTLMGRSATWAACTTVALALLKTSLKRCGFTSLLPPKDILIHCSVSLPVTRKVDAFVETRRKPFAGTGAHKQRVALSLQTLCRGCARDSYSFTCTHARIKGFCLVFNS